MNRWPPGPDTTPPARLPDVSSPPGIGWFLGQARCGLPARFRASLRPLQEKTPPALDSALAASASTFAKVSPGPPERQPTALFPAAPASLEIKRRCALPGRVPGAADPAPGPAIRKIPAA